MNAEMDLGNIAVYCLTSAEKAQVIEYFTTFGYCLPKGWSIEQLADDCRKFPYVAVQNGDYVTAFNKAYHKTIIGFAELFANHIEHIDADMIL